MINLKCPNCQKKLRIPESAVGKKARCPGCSKVIRFGRSQERDKATRDSESQGELKPRRRRKTKPSPNREPAKPKVDDQEAAWDAFAAAAVSSPNEDEFAGTDDQEHPLLSADNGYPLADDEYSSPFGGSPPMTSQPRNKKVTQCTDCGGTVSRRAEMCPHCGAPVSSPKSISAGRKQSRETGSGSVVVRILIFAGISLALVVGAVVIWRPNEDNYLPSGLERYEVAKLFAGVYDDKWTDESDATGKAESHHLRYYYVYSPCQDEHGVYYVVDVDDSSIHDCGIWRFHECKQYESSSAFERYFASEYIAEVEHFSTKKRRGLLDRRMMFHKSTMKSFVIYADRYRTSRYLAATQQEIPDSTHEVFKTGQIDGRVVEEVRVPACEMSDEPTMTCYRLKEFPKVVARADQ